MTFSSYVTEAAGRQNIFAKEVRPQVIEHYTGHSFEAEKANGRWAMIGFIAMIGAYSITGQVMPGVF